jgi:uncharacterized protein (DUF2147 family)
MRNILLAISILTMANNSFAQEEADRILGIWHSKEKEGSVQIYKVGDQYFGKLVALKESTDENGNKILDVNNPEKMKRTAPLIGVVFLNKITYMANKRNWQGTLYDYDGANGNTYDSYIKILEDGTLNIKGFWGLSFFGLNPGLILTKVE